MHEGPQPATTPAIPSRRARTLLFVGAAVAVLLLLFPFLPRDRPHAGARAGTSGEVTTPATPYDQAVAALRAHSEALLRGDEAGWLAAVNPARSALRTRYGAVFRSLRALGVTRFEYQPGVAQVVRDDTAAVSFRVDVAYCLGTSMCPDTAGTDGQKPPRIAQKLTLRPVGGRYVITAVGASTQPDVRQPTPWENGALVFAQGRRVTVAAGPGQAKDLARAAAVADRYAALIGTPRRKYRIYLAGEKQWKSWYGGVDDAWVIGLAVPLNMHGMDVLVRMRSMGDPRVLRVTLQHELAHVVTLSGAYRADAAEDTWLSEGIAEYVGWQPRRAVDSRRLYSVRWALNGGRVPRSMVPDRPGRKARARAGDAFYGLSHFAADCMARRYGERKLFTFVRMVLTEDNTYDQAARDAYGVPFATVDRACVKWIRQQAR